MHVESSTKLWIQQREEVERHRLRCSTGDFELRFGDGEIVVRSFGPICTARLVWAHRYGERALERGPCTSVFAHIARILRNGPTFGPVHQADSDTLRFVQFDSDDSFRATRPQGEVRVKPFLDEYVLLFVPDGGFRALLVAKDPNELKLTAELYGPEWASCTGPRYAVRFEGEHRELHVSNNPTELAYHEIDKHTRFSLRPHSLPDGDRPAQAALYLFRDGEKTQLLALVPIDPTSHVSVLWSDEQPVRSDRRTAPLPTSSVNPLQAEPAGSVAMPPGLQALVAQYLDEVAERPGDGKDMRSQAEKLLRAIERGRNVSGWGVPLRGALERACADKFVGSGRALGYLVKALKDDGILARPWGRKCQFVFAEFHRPDSPAVALLCQRYNVTPASVFGTGSPTVEPLASRRAPSSPMGRPPPTTPPASAPTPAGREQGMHMSPPTWPSSTPITPPASAPAPGGARQEPDRREHEQASHPGPVPDRRAERGVTAPPPWSPVVPPFGAGQPEDPFAAIQKLLSLDPVRTGASDIHVPPTAPATTFAPPVAPAPAAPVSAAPPVEDFMREEFMFLNSEILSSSAEPTDEDLEIEDGDGLPRGPPDED